MNTKSAGISLVVSIFVISLLFSINLFFNGAINASSIALFISSLGSAGFFILLYTVLKTARTDKNLIVYSVLVFGGLTLSIFHSIIVWDIYFTTWLTLLVALSWNWYLSVYSRFSDRGSETEFSNSESLPNIVLKDLDGNSCSLDNFKSQNLILIFYRGNWCPLCMTQIEEIVDQYKELEKLNAQVLFISPQPERYTRKLASKYNMESNFYIDEENGAASKLGIIDENGLPLGIQIFGYESDTVKPTVIILDQERQVVYSDLTDNYRIRPEPKELLKELAVLQ